MNCYKEPFRCARDAKRAANRARRKWRAFVYRCDRCGYFHLSGRPPIPARERVGTG